MSDRNREKQSGCRCQISGFLCGDRRPSLHSIYCLSLFDFFILLSFSPSPFTTKTPCRFCFSIAATKCPHFSPNLDLKGQRALPRPFFVFLFSIFLSFFLYLFRKLQLCLKVLNSKTTSSVLREHNRGGIPLPRWTDVQ